MRTEGLFTKAVPPRLIWMAATLFMVLLGHLLQSSAHLNHDVAWIAHSARWLLQGRQFGVDVIDINPPMAWWLSLPAAMLVESGVVNEPLAVRIVFWSYFLISAALLYSALSRLDRGQRVASTGWLAAFIGIATLAPGPSFGQREYLSVLFAMPYLAAAVVRLEGGAAIRTPVSVAIGILAGIGFGIKPFFLAVPLAVEALLFARLGWRVLFRVESVTIALTILAYSLLIIVLVPQYLTFTIPLLKSIYWAFDARSLSFVVERYQAVAGAFVYGVLIALLARCWTSQHTVLLLAGAGYSVSYFVQGKGFVYHAYPVLMCALAFLGVCVASSLGRLRIDRPNMPRALHAALALAVPLLALAPAKQAHDATVDWYVQYNSTWGNIGRHREAVIELINRHVPTRGSYFFAFSTHPYPAFPTASYTIADWSSRSPTQGIVAAFARLDEVKDPALRERVVAAAGLQRRMIVEDFERRPPSLVFLERSRARFGLKGRTFDDLDFYTQDPDFEQIWTRYEEQAPIGPLRVFTLRRTDQPVDQQHSVTRR